MSDWSSLAGFRTISGKLSIAYYGAWVADVVLAVSSPIPSGLIPLVIGDLMLQGTVFRQFSFSGSRSARVVGGFGGWQQTIGPAAYQSSAGVPTLMILNDAAIAAGETLGAATVTSLTGQTFRNAFVRESAPAVRTLENVGGPIWWIDNSGNTQLIDRAVLPASGSTADTGHLGPITSQFNVIEWSGMKGRFQIATETYSDWMPGRTFTSPTVSQVQTASWVGHTWESNGTARTTVLSTP